MKYIAILLCVGVITCIVGLSLAQAAITLPQKIQISANTRAQKLIRSRQVRSLPPLPSLAPRAIDQVVVIRVTAPPLPSPTASLAPHPTMTPTKAPTPTRMPDPTQTPPTITPQPQPTSSSVRIIPTSSSVSQQSLQDATNAYRAQAGKNNLSLRDDLCALAEIRAQEIASSFDHGGFRSRIDSGELKALQYKAVAENIWHGTGDATRIVKDWSESSGHNKNLLEDWQWGCGAHSNGYAAYLYLR